MKDVNPHRGGPEGGRAAQPRPLDAVRQRRERHNVIPVNVRGHDRGRPPPLPRVAGGEVCGVVIRGAARARAAHSGEVGGAGGAGLGRALGGDAVEQGGGGAAAFAQVLDERSALGNDLRKGP